MQARSGTHFTAEARRRGEEQKIDWIFTGAGVRFVNAQIVASCGPRALKEGHESRRQFESSVISVTRLFVKCKPFTDKAKKGAHHAYPSDLGHNCRLRFSSLGRFRRAIHLAGDKQTGTRRSTEADPRAARVQYIGLAVLIPGVVSPQLPATEFARGLAYGDLAAATLALIALAALRTRLAGPLVWIFNIFGTADLLNAFYQGNRISLGDTPGLLSAGYFIPIFVVPLLLITHVLAFRLLVRKEAAAPSRVVRDAA
jgi:hypothetical protein